MLFAISACDIAKKNDATPDQASKNEIMEMNNLAGNYWFVDTAIINGQLYCTYVDSLGKQTLYTVTDKGAEVVYEGKDDSIKSFDFSYSIDNNMLLSTETGAFAVFDINELAITNIENVYSPTPLHHNPLFDHEWFRYIVGGVRYFADTKEIYRYQNGEYELVLRADSTKDEHFFFTARGYFCVYGSELYYLHSKNNGSYICRYDMNTKKLIDEVCVSNNPDISPCFAMIANDDDVYYIDNQETLYHINLINKQKEELFCAKGKDSLLCINYNNNNLYVGVNTTGNNKEDGLYVIYTDNNNQTEKLVDGDIFDVYIFDDDSVYYGQSDSISDMVYRLSLDDLSTEEILRME